MIGALKNRLFGGADEKPAEKKRDILVLDAYEMAADDEEEAGCCGTGGCGSCGCGS